ncbi:VOC family protein [Bosea sp. RAF48]|uniref:VOC family protein n=1 Tax=Bosea sp. RAF48 TaxID=3237480 RepID=UPI003F8E8C3C
MTNASDWLVDHTGIGVSDIARSAHFYEMALKPLGAHVVSCISGTMKPADRNDVDLAGVAFGIDYPVFWIDTFHPSGVRQHTAFRASSREQADAFHRAAVAAGGTDNGVPGIRSGGYPPGYYAAFVHDPDGNNIEAVFRGDMRSD